MIGSVEILKGMQIVDVGIFIANTSTLIIGDIHLGQEEDLQKHGVLIPQNQFEQIHKKTLEIVKITKPKKIIINGDLKHTFGNMSGSEWDKITKYLKSLKKYSDIIVVKGNHDAILKPVLDKLEISLVDHYLENKLYVCHGDIIQDNKDFKESKTIIIGHEHPAIKLRDGARMESYKCFLLGKYEKKNLIVMPSLNPLKEGSDVLSEKTLSPYIDDKKVRNFKVFIIGEKIYPFGKIKDLDKLM